MRTLALTLLFTLIGAVANTHAAELPISVSVAVPASDNGERRIDHRDRNSHFHVVLTNTSDKPQRIWQEWCSWGYYGLTFEFTDERGAKWVAKKKPQNWTRNFPSWWTLNAHESLVLDVHLGDSDKWDGVQLPDNGKVTMQAVVQFAAGDESRKHEIWTGRVVSKADKFVFRQR